MATHSIQSDDVQLGVHDQGDGFPILMVHGMWCDHHAFDDVAEVARGRVEHALLVGEAAEKIETALAGHVPCERVGTIDRAVKVAAERGRAGDTVLLVGRSEDDDWVEVELDDDTTGWLMADEVSTDYNFD